MTEMQVQSIYELSVCARVTWQAHAVSNAGNNGSNRLLPRRQLLADGHETDACSGNIAKHYHAVLLTEYLEAAGTPVCPACSARDGRRAAALIDRADYRNLSLERIVRECGVCDVHGSTEARQRLSKHSLIEFSFALALPDRHSETTQLFTRLGESKEEGQMLMKMTARSGEYALCVRYKCAGVGLDTDKWRAVLTDEQERMTRHRAILAALRDCLLSPQGALTATMLPHLTGLRGAIVARSTTGRAPLYSPLQEDFVERLSALSNEACCIFSFETIDSFHERMNALIETSSPSMPAALQ